MVARVTLILDKVNAPPWAQRFCLELEKAFNGLTSVPTRIVDAAADLPPAADWRGRQIYCKNVGAGANRVVVSDGVNWIRTDTGATV